jgi:hypothetical protein
MPAGYQALYGNPFRTAADTSHNSIGYICYDFGQYGPEFPPNDVECSRHMAAIISGPSCWDGVNLDSADHKSHTSGTEAGKCPDSHPIRIVRNVIESIWDMTVIKGPRKLVWAQGDETGLGFHADFVNGWDQAVLEDAVQNCLDGRPCPFDNRNGNPEFQNDEKRETCAAEYKQAKEPLIVGEVCSGTIPTLCGKGGAANVLNTQGSQDLVEVLIETGSQLNSAVAGYQRDAVVAENANTLPETAEIDSSDETYAPKCRPRARF